MAIRLIMVITFICIMGMVIANLGVKASDKAKTMCSNKCMNEYKEIDYECASACYEWETSL